MLSDKELSLSGLFPVFFRSLSGLGVALNHEGRQGGRRTTSQAS
jgi:hypothetical protein